MSSGQHEYFLNEIRDVADSVRRRTVLAAKAEDAFRRSEKRLKKTLAELALATSDLLDTLTKLEADLSNRNEDLDVPQTYEEKISLLLNKNTPFLLCCDICKLLVDDGYNIVIIAKLIKVTERHVRNLVAISSFSVELRRYISTKIIGGTYAGELVSKSSEAECLAKIKLFLEFVDKNPSYRSKIRRGENLIKKSVFEKFFRERSTL